MSIPATVAPAPNNTGSHASRSSRLAAKAITSRGSGATCSLIAPLAGEPPISIATSSTAATPLPTVKRPSARNGTGGAGASTARSGPRPAIMPPSVPSCANWPVKLAPSPLATPCPSSVTFSPAAPSRPAAVSRAVKLPVLTAEPSRARRRKGTRIERRQRRIDAGESQPSDRQTAVLDPCRECRKPGRWPREKHAGLGRPRDAQVWPAQHQLTGIDASADQRPKGDAQPQRLDPDRKIARPLAADIDLCRGQHGLRQQRERDRSADRDRLTQRRGRQHLDRRAIARPVEPLRHLPDGKQQQRGDCPGRGQRYAPTSHVRTRRRNRRRPAFRSRTHRQDSTRHCRSP